jgi:hypothetical protein
MTGVATRRMIATPTMSDIRSMNANHPTRCSSEPAAPGATTSITRVDIGNPVNSASHIVAKACRGASVSVRMFSNDLAERRGVAPTTNEADLSPSSTPSLAQRRRGPVIARAGG